MRINQYFDNIIKLANKGIHSDLFIKHFVNYLKNRTTNTTIGNVWEITKIRILMRYNPISFSKYFEIDDYQLYIEK